MSNSSLKVLPALLVAIAAGLITQTVCGQVPTPTPEITFTEINNTTLTAVYTNGSGVSTNLAVTFEGPDSWDVTLPSFLFATDGSAWLEPSSTTSDNFASPFSNRAGFFVFSDQLVPVGVAPPSPNDTISPNSIALDNTNPSAGVRVYGIFNDLGDSPAGVPDTGTTASLFGLSLTGLAFLRRKLC